MIELGNVDANSVGPSPDHGEASRDTAGKHDISSSASVTAAEDAGLARLDAILTQSTNVRLMDARPRFIAWPRDGLFLRNGDQ